METTATILHADLDAFYASVEQLLDPSLRDKPIAVGGGVVLAASYEAKSFGISSGMSGWRARELCPELIFVGGHFNDYQRLGDAAINVLNDFTPLVERISIDGPLLTLRDAPTFSVRRLRSREQYVIACAQSLGFQSQSAWRGPSTSRRLHRKWPNLTGW
jgi:nucleotidyltransferase/DNA polymerase involved in DNA repair